MKNFKMIADHIQKMVAAVEDGKILSDLCIMFDGIKQIADDTYAENRSKFDQYGDAVDGAYAWMSDFFVEVDFLRVDFDIAKKTAIFDRDSCKMRLETMAELLKEGEADNHGY